MNPTFKKAMVKIIKEFVREDWVNSDHPNDYFAKACAALIDIENDQLNETEMLLAQKTVSLTDNMVSNWSNYHDQQLLECDTANLNSVLDQFVTYCEKESGVKKC